MRKFFLGVVVTLVILAGGAYVYLRVGYLDLRADIQPSAFEQHSAMAFMDASMDRHAPEQKNPIEPSEAKMIEGVRLYNTHCAECHGAPDHPQQKFGHPFYPPAPLFTESNIAGWSPVRLMRLKSPYIESLMSRFAALFTRVGTRDLPPELVDEFSVW